MTDVPTAYEAAISLATRLDNDPDGIDPETAARVATVLLDAEGDLDPGYLSLVTRLLGFAVHAAADHPLVPEWLQQLGFAHGWIAEETGSAEECSRAVACSLAVVSVPQVSPELAGVAAEDAARMTGFLLRTADVTADRARWLIAALDEISLSWKDSWHRTVFEFQLAKALWSAYPATGDITELERAAGILRRVLAEPLPAEAEWRRVDAGDLFATVLEELYFAGGDPGLLEEALSAALHVRELLPEDDELLPTMHGVVARLADEIFWNSEGEATTARETAMASFAAKRAATGLDEDETVSLALLVQTRGCTLEDIPTLTAAVAVLEQPERAPGAEFVLAGLHELLTHLAGPQHAWQTIDWATRALARPGLEPGIALFVYGTRLVGLAVALEAFGGDEVAARCDADAILAETRSEALAGTDAERAELELGTAQLRAQWTGDRFPFDFGLLQSTSTEIADALRRLGYHADEDRKAKLAAVATLLEDMVPVLLGDRDPEPFRAALRDESLAGTSDVDDVLKWMDQCLALRAMAGGEQAVGPQAQQMLADMVSGLPEAERRSGAGAVLNSLVEAVSLLQGDPTARSAAYQKVVRLCDELPEKMASSPFVRGIRGTVAAQLALGDHDDGQVEPMIEDLERALDAPDSGWPGHRMQMVQQLGHLLRRRGGPGDAERSRDLGIRMLADRARCEPAHDHYEPEGAVSQFVRAVSDWCRDDEACDDLVRVVEAERGVALARGAGARISEVDGQLPVEPMGPAEIQPVLRALGLDALVYLVPNAPTRGGTVVVVPAEAAATMAQLPLLAEEWFTSTISAEPAVLDSLAGWAWLAGGAAVLAAAERAASGKIPRVAMVPIGVLAAVPWAAAWRETGAGRRYLTQDVELTLIPSAHLLACAASADGEPVLVPDCPDGMPGADYDEAFQPSSALLLGGARAVIRGVWPCAGDPVLLSLVRDCLDERRMSPAAALREAQLRMLDPRGAALAEVADWGGFAHLGA